MILDEVIAALRRGCCTEARAREAGCGLCVPHDGVAADLRGAADVANEARVEAEREARFAWERQAEAERARGEARAALRDLVDSITAPDAFPITTTPGGDVRLVENARITAALRAARRALGGAVGDPPRHPPPTTSLALDGTETPIEEALRRAAEDHHSIAGDRCEVGSECGRLGCPECQQ